MKTKKRKDIYMIKQKPKLSNEIKLSEHETKKILDLDREVGAVKVALANVDLQIYTLEIQRSKLAVKAHAANELFVKFVADLAKEKGIDVDDLSQRWNFDVIRMSFMRTA